LSTTYFTSKDIVIISIFGCLSALSTLTTNFIPAPLPGLYAAISIPVSTTLILMVRTIIDKDGAATLMQIVSGFISTFLPGGPPVKWIIIPSWAAGGIIVDAYFHLLNNIRKSKLFYTVIGLINTIPGDFIIYWAFNAFLGWSWPLTFFLYGFVAIHAILGGLAGFLFFDIFKRIKPEVERIR